tara:strand:+ start:163 stop:1449 length:1287 start_codon:yes stop_codon:yes gene_type:complete
MSDTTKEMEKLKERIEELEFNELFYQTKLKELEGKRIYYRGDRENKFNSLFQQKINHLNSDEVEAEKIRIKEMTIHEKYEYITKDYERLCSLREWCLNETPISFYNDEIGGDNETDCEKLMVEIFEYIRDDYYDNCFDKATDVILDDPPETIRNKCIALAMDDGEVVSYDTYDECDDEKRDYETNIEDANDFIEAKQKWTKYDDIDNITSYGNIQMKDKFIILYDYIDRQREMVEKYKSGYETLKEDKDDDAMEMIENLMNKTSEVVERDMERVKEINRLKEKVNKNCGRIESLIRQYVNPTHSRDIVGSLSFCKRGMENYVKEITGRDVVLDYDYLSDLSWSIRYEINKMLEGENMLVDKLKEHITRLVFQIEEGTKKSPSYIKGNKEEEERFNIQIEKDGYNKHHACFLFSHIIASREKLMDINNY